MNIGRMGRKLALVAGLALAIAAPAHSLLSGEAPVVEQKAKENATSKEELFEFSRVSIVRLTFTPGQWAAMGRKGGGSWPPPPPQRRGPNARPPPATQRISCGPSMRLAPTSCSGGADRDGKLSREEFTLLADRWFTQW